MIKNYDNFCMFAQPQASPNSGWQKYWQHSLLNHNCLLFDINKYLSNHVYNTPKLTYTTKKKVRVFYFILLFKKRKFCQPAYTLCDTRGLPNKMRMNTNKG